MTPIRRPRALAPLAALALGLASGCSPISPAAYEPPEPPPMEGPFAPNEELAKIEVFELGGARGPEDVDVDSEGRLYTATDDGRVLRISVDASGARSIETFADTGGRPLGLDFDGDGNLIVADAVAGLVSIDPDGEVTVLSTEADGLPFKFTDDVDVAADGRIYFSDASSKFGMHEYLYDMMEARPYGRLLRYDPSSGETEVLLDGLYFANGVAVSPDQRFVLVNETYRYRIVRYWLEGERAGSSEIFADNLPGFPDGVSSNDRDTFWVALFTVRNGMADWMHSRPWIKSLVASLPSALWPKPEPYGFVVALDTDGEVLRTLQDPEGEHIFPVTSAEEHEGGLWLGTLTGPIAARYPLDAP